MVFVSMRAEPLLALNEIKACLREASDLSEALLVATFACSGAKLNEVLNMRVSDVWEAPVAIGGRPFPDLSNLAARLSQYARTTRVAMEPPGRPLADLKAELLWLTPRGRVPYTRNSIAVMLGRISERAGVEVTATRFRITRLAYFWHELQRADPDALQRFAGLGTQFEVLRRIEEAILARPEVLEDVAPGWENSLLEEALPADGARAAAQ